jgi:hypothetical protein
MNRMSPRFSKKYEEVLSIQLFEQTFALLSLAFPTSGLSRLGNDIRLAGDIFDA